mmetsp:Transcript_78582/g.202394  ORF Transcript_78582/g.202394 Transcript_78582/m.202394 type:complete len:387 (+) Transcript_78582:48-1208(+)
MVLARRLRNPRKRLALRRGAAASAAKQRVAKPGAIAGNRGVRAHTYQERGSRTRLLNVEPAPGPVRSSAHAAVGGAGHDAHRRPLGRAAPGAGGEDLAAHHGEARDHGRAHAIILHEVHEVVVHVDEPAGDHHAVRPDVQEVPRDRQQKEQRGEEAPGRTLLLHAPPVVLRQVEDEEHADEGDEDAQGLQRVDCRVLAHPKRLPERARRQVIGRRGARLLEHHLGGALGHALGARLHEAPAGPLREPLAALLHHALAEPVDDPLGAAEGRLLDPTVLQLVACGPGDVVLAMAVAVVVVVVVRQVLRAELSFRGVPGHVAGRVPGGLAGPQLLLRLLHRGHRLQQRLLGAREVFRGLDLAGPRLQLRGQRQLERAAGHRGGVRSGED